MKCVIPGANVKVFGKAIHCLSKVGDDIWFQPVDNALILKSVNLTRSAYGCFTFFPTFFQYFDPKYRVNSGDASAANEYQRCKVNAKSCISVFKSLSTIEKTVDKCRILLDTFNCRLIFQLCCKHGIVKTFNLTYAECDPLIAKVPQQQCRNHMLTHSRVLSEVVVNFQSTLEEVTLAVNEEWVKISNYVEDEPDPSKVVYTEMTLSSHEFDEYQIGLNSDITFCLRELKALLSFTDTVNMPLNIHFDTAGKPLVFEISSDPTFEVTLVLATVDADVCSSSSVTNSQQQQPQQQDVSINNTTMAVNVTRGETRREQRGKQQGRDESARTVQPEVVRNELAATAGDESLNTISRPPLNTERGSDRTVTEEVQVNSEDEYQEDFVPPSPPNKKLKTLFSLTQSTVNSDKHDMSEVLAADSDED